VDGKEVCGKTINLKGVVEGVAADARSPDGLSGGVWRYRIIPILGNGENGDTANLQDLKAIETVTNLLVVIKKVTASGSKKWEAGREGATLP